ncbi:MAG: signal recognition particle receptor subunit alpha, partial [Nanoarchaeota archaeon]
MFKFLKDKLKGALSSFSKKAEEVATEEVIEQEVDVPEEKPVAKAKKEKTVKKTEKKTKPKKETPAEEPEVVKEIPKITIEKEPEKQGFFSKLKGVFTKKEEVEILEEHVEKPPVEFATPPEEVVVEENEIEVEGSPLKKIRIHDNIESEQPIIDKVFEPIEPETPKVEKKTEAPEEYTPAKIQERLKHISDDEAEEEKDTEELEEAETTEEETTEDETEEEPEAEPIVEKKGFFARMKEAITTKKISETQFEDLFWDIEVVLLENNVAVEVVNKIKDDLKLALVNQPIPRGQVETKILSTLKTTIKELFDVPTINILNEAKKKKPYVICFVGITGSGKTTPIAKFT